MQFQISICSVHNHRLWPPLVNQASSKLQTCLFAPSFKLQLFYQRLYFIRLKTKTRIVCKQLGFCLNLAFGLLKSPTVIVVHSSHQSLYISPFFIATHELVVLLVPCSRSHDTRLASSRLPQEIQATFEDQRLFILLMKSRQPGGIQTSQLATDPCGTMFSRLPIQTQQTYL